MSVKIHGAEFEIRWTSIVGLSVDAIVNAARETLTGGGGVDGLIHARAGNGLRRACEAIPLQEFDFFGVEIRCRPGQAFITDGFDLPSRHVIHTVGPRLNEGETPSDEHCQVLESCYENSMRLASEARLHSIAFPCISTGLFNFPLDRAVEIACTEVINFLSKNPNSSVKKVVFCCNGDEEEKAYGLVLSDLILRLISQKAE